VEALLRWNHRIDGTVGPDYFLSAAEESGMIVPIGQWVLNQTCTRMREWLGQGLRIFASVNLSKRQLLQADLVDVIGRELSQNGIPPEVLYVEIAEGFNTFNPEHMDQVINRLGQAGIRVAIDDFGVGYSSLSRVNLAYTRVLKIDRSIIDKCPNDRQSSTVCIAAINLASSLGLLSLAEGVENLNQVRFLTKYGCALAQGYYFSEPVLPAEITNFHRSKKVWKL
jgi:EAL domain-containing protein (putative c-di-GMP-specific phosphodiesterase class I)